ncbi:E1 protein [Human papillomavirus type 211]|uniref:Replication protein E1 n=1 Tax=Human papillomavirus type 211 TaxID=2060135 RepID=A0A2H4V8C7_9PAPI|nr:E1 protein [Human papillomavirus type 211]
MADPKGIESIDTIENESEWFIVGAECVDDLDSLEILEDSSQCTNISQLIDDAVDDLDQGNSLALFNEQVAEECELAISKLKRKYVKSPEQSIAALSPRLQAVKLSGQGKSKRKLFQDSGIEEDEAESATQVVSETIEKTVSETPSGADTTIELLRCSNRRATALAKFKQLFGVSYTELTRLYKSDKTCSQNWVTAVFNVNEEVVQSSKISLQQHVEFMQVISIGLYALYLLTFKAGKSRETVIKLLCQLLNIQEYQILTDPPILRSPAVAIYFYKTSLSNISYKYGDYPNWLATQILLDHRHGTVETFDLSKMIQWAFDNEMLDEPSVAYNYALAAEEDANARAFLQSNNQAKYLRDCVTMVKHYKKYEMRQMTMGEWIDKCCNETDDNGDWKTIAHFLRFQNVNFIEFLTAFKPFLKGIPKKHCLVFWGPPDTGKSLFCFSLIHFLKGKVISFMNSTSHFWLSPLTEGKIGFIDDATYKCWLYFDVNLRNGLDGTPVSVDAKHKHPVQIKLPPLLVTTNLNVLEDNTFMYLRSRLKCFCFPNKLPVSDQGELPYEITDATWASFFRKFESHLELNQEDGTKGGNPGILDRAFRCTARSNSDYD